MNQEEIIDFIRWCEQHLNVKLRNCDESIHMYFADTMIAGWAGDTNKYFVTYGSICNKCIRLYNEWKHMEDERWVV